MSVVEFRRGDLDAIEIGQLYLRGKTSMVNSVRYFIDAGQRLIDKKQHLPHGQWLPWLEANADALGFESRFTAAKLMRAAEKCAVNGTFDEEQAALISREIWGNNAVRGTLNTGDNEWYTPSRYVELARTVLGGIDLDPASSPKAQEVVRAQRYFTAEQDGLRHEWHGRVWLNPPYAQPLIDQFVDKFLEERSAGNVTAGIVLVHNYTSSSWFQKAAQIVDGICFAAKRIAFESPNGERRQHRPKGSASSITAITSKHFPTTSLKSVSSWFQNNEHCDYFCDFVTLTLHWPWRDLQPSGLRPRQDARSFRLGWHPGKLRHPTSIW